MHINVRAPKPTDGYALITVLFSLAIITILLTSASRLNINHARYVSDQTVLANRLSEAETFLNLSVAEWRLQGKPQLVSFEFQGESYVTEFQDVGGLIDLNTASPSLLFTLLTAVHIENPTDVIAKYQAWRQQGFRLQRVSDFARVAGFSSEAAQRIGPFVTVHSGRRGIAPNASPLILLELLVGENGTAEYLATQLPRTYKSHASKVNFRVTFLNAQGAVVASLTAHIPNNQAPVKLLEFAL